MTDYETIRYEVADGVLTLTLHRPDRLNAFTATMAEELIEPKLKSLQLLPIEIFNSSSP